jgi:hypothetical protein
MRSQGKVRAVDGFAGDLVVALGKEDAADAIWPPVGLSLATDRRRLLPVQGA